jgi:hypothetical protein
MKINISKLTKPQSHLFSSVLLAFGLFAFLHPHRAIPRESDEIE